MTEQEHPTMPTCAGENTQPAQERLKGKARPLLAAEVPLDRIQPALDYLADNVRGHEVNAAGSLREGFPLARATP
jgi:hypothetical protein